MDGLRFTSIPEDRYHDVILHLRNNFFADEPLNYSVQLCQPGEAHADLEEHSLNTLRDDLSQMAVDVNTGEIAGVALNGVQHASDLTASLSKLSNLPDTKFHRIFKLLYSVNVALDLFKAYDVDKMFECRIMSVDGKFRGRGLGTELLVKSEEVARKAGFKLMKQDATGVFSQRIGQSLGFETVHQVRYSEYVSEDSGEAIFKPPPPHEYLMIMVKVLQ